MLDALSDFLERLRARGVSISPAEALDAARALEAVGVESRPAARAALGLTCAKTRAGRRLLDAEFARFFAAPGPAEGRGERRREPSGAGLGPGQGQGEPGGRALPPRGAKRDAGERRLVEALRQEARRGTRRLKGLRAAPARASREGSRGREERRCGEAALRHQVLRDRLPAAVATGLVAEALRMVAELKLRESRRRRPGRRGIFSGKRTLRGALATGGVPFVIRRERRRRREPRVVLLMDVSRSVERAAGLFLVLAAGLLERLGRVRVIAFVDRPVEATRALLRWARNPAGERSFARALDGIEGLNLAAASDYGRVFHALAEQRGVGGSDVVLVILGDGRSNRFAPLGWALAELVRGARAALWLVPEPGATWGSGDSALGEYLPEVDVAVETADLAGLARGVRELRRTLGA